MNEPERYGLLCNVVGISVSGIYMAITFEVHLVVGCVLAHTCITVKFTYP